MCLLAAAGCGNKIEQIGAAAESARNASEHMAENANDANRNREAQVLANAQSMEDQIQAAKKDVPGGPRPRYELHKDAVGDSWTVYDTANGRAVRVDTKTESGLSHDNAEAMLNSIQRQEKDEEILLGRAR